MKEDKIGTILMVLLFILIIVVAIILDNGDNYIYECSDYDSNIVYCKDVRIGYSGAWGEMKDGTSIAITSYKKINKKDMITSKE